MWWRSYCGSSQSCKFQPQILSRLLEISLMKSSRGVCASQLWRVSLILLPFFRWTSFLRQSAKRSGCSRLEMQRRILAARSEQLAREEKTHRRRCILSSKNEFCLSPFQIDMIRNKKRERHNVCALSPSFAAKQSKQVHHAGWSARHTLRGQKGLAKSLPQLFHARNDDIDDFHIKHCLTISASSRLKQ